MSNLAAARRLERLPPVDVLVLELVQRRRRTLLLLLLEDVLGAGASARVHHVRPVLPRVPRQLLPALHDEHARIADLARPARRQLEAVVAVILVFSAVGETGTAKYLGSITGPGVICSLHACNFSGL